MTSPPATVGEVERITLNDGTELDARQSLAVYLRVTEPNMTWDEIALQAGYRSGSACRDFVSRRNGQQAVREVIKHHMAEAARVGFTTMLKLAKTAKSENVRQLAAADLLDRAGFARKPWAAENERQAGQQGFEININLGNIDPKDVTIEGSVKDAGTGDSQ